ncbi:serine protease [Porticoccus sp. W117]|uniref:S1 family peptidase n=1 Tax=Porticoccus sp. W117 TaxID=3054777 RepID=UPI002595189A|nr:serine protease [Porticoccus sp. W117]MDM3870414.1 serine protease [Porticoccus sp. W117]
MRFLPAFIKTSFYAVIFSCLTNAAYVAVESDLVDDYQLLDTFSDRTAALYKAGKSAPVKDLMAQLRRKQTRLTLPAAKSTEVLPADLYRQFKKSTLAVGGIFDCGNCPEHHPQVASGFVIDGKGVGVTNYHVIETITADDTNVAMSVMTYEGKVYPITEILAASKLDDVVIFRFDTAGDTLPAFSLADQVRVGGSANVISNPQEHFFLYSRGVVSRYYKAVDDQGNVTGTEALSITADYSVGSSGGPIFDDNGNIIGVVAATYGLYSDEERSDLQMVVKQIVPLSRIKALIKP